MGRFGTFPIYYIFPFSLHINIPISEDSVSANLLHNGDIGIFRTSKYTNTNLQLATYSRDLLHFLNLQHIDLWIRYFLKYETLFRTGRGNINGPEKNNGPKKVKAVFEASQRAVSARVHPESGPLRAGAPKGGKWGHKIINFLLVL